MPNYRRKLILLKIAERLSAIQKVNGYETDAGLHLYHGPVNLGPDDPQLAIAIAPGPASVTIQQNAKTVLMSVDLHALAKENLDDPLLVVEDLIGDIKRAIESAETAQRNLAGLASKIDAGDVEPLPRQEGSTTVGARVEYRIDYQESWGDPEA